MFIRSSYGVEFDNQQRTPHHNFLWGFVVVIPVLALIFLGFRGCAGLKQAPVADDVLHAERYDAHEEPSKRAKPSFTHHVLSHWLGSKQADAQTAVDAAESPKKPKHAIPASSAPAADALRKLPATVQSLVNQATAAEQANTLAEARMIYHHLLTRTDVDAFIPTFESKIAEINLKLLFSKDPMPEKTKWRIGPGDSISKIARKTGSNPEYISIVNGIDKPTQLKLDMDIWVMKNPRFALFVNRKAASMVVTLNGRFFKRYALDAADLATLSPGEYKVRSRGKKDQPERPASTQFKQRLAATCWIITETNNSLQETAFGLFSKLSRATAQQPSLTGLFLATEEIEELYLYLPLSTPITVIN